MKLINELISLNEQKITAAQQKLYNAISKVVRKNTMRSDIVASARWDGEEREKQPRRGPISEYAVEVIKEWEPKLKAGALEGEHEFAKVWRSFASRDPDIFDYFAEELFQELGAKMPKHGLDDEADTYEDLMKRLGFMEAAAPKVSKLNLHNDMVRQLKGHGFTQNSKETTQGAFKTWLKHDGVKFEKFKEIAGTLGFKQHPAAEHSDMFKTEFVKGDHRLTYQGHDADPYSEERPGSIFIDTARSHNYKMGIDEALNENIYRVHLKSVPGQWELYDGHVDVSGAGDADDEELFRSAVRRLSKTSFPDRPGLSSWKLIKVERL